METSNPNHPISVTVLEPLPLPLPAKSSSPGPKFELKEPPQQQLSGLSSAEDMAMMNVADEEADGGCKGRHLIVNYLPQTFNDADLYNTFAPFGALESVRIMKDLKTGYSFGFGFVNFMTETDAVTAQEEMNGLELTNKRIKVSFARPPSEELKHTNLYITNLPREITEDELTRMFRPFGPIIQKKVLKDKYTGLPRGVAFIRYEKRDQAARAIMGMNNMIPPGCDEPIKIRLAEDHGKQKAAYLAGFQAGLFVPKGKRSRTGRSRGAKANKNKEKRGQGSSSSRSLCKV